MRKYYIDNLRWISILLLIPFHTCMIYNNWGENFYVKSSDNAVLSSFIFICSPWFMPLLFAIAGVSTCYALKKRTTKQYLKERVYKLLIPLISGILLLVPIQTYYAEKFHNAYDGGYFNQYILFFTKKTDLTGATGGFTPAHLWFILYLFIISILALPILLKYKNSEKKIRVEKLTVLKILPMFLIFAVMALVLNIGGKSLGEYFALFMLGYFILSEDIIQEKLDENRWYLFLGFVVLTVSDLLLINVWGLYSGLCFDIFYKFLSWIGILSLLGMGRHYLNFQNRITKYFVNASFPIYILHQSLLILTAYYALRIIPSIYLQVVLTQTEICAMVDLIGSIVSKIKQEIIRKEKNYEKCIRGSNDLIEYWACHRIDFWDCRI